MFTSNAGRGVVDFHMQVGAARRSSKCNSWHVVLAASLWWRWAGCVAQLYQQGPHRRLADDLHWRNAEFLKTTGGGPSQCQPCRLVGSRRWDSLIQATVDAVADVALRSRQVERYRGEFLAAGRAPQGTEGNTGPFYDATELAFSTTVGSA